MAEPTFAPTPLETILSPRSTRPPTTDFWRGRSGERKPLWAILGETPPLSWEPPDTRHLQLLELAAETAGGDSQAQEPAATSDTGDGRGPGIWVTAHPIFGVGPLHTAVEYFPEDGARQWISAGPDLSTGRLVSGVGTEDNPTERSSDQPKHNVTLGRVTPPEGMTDTEYWEQLKALDQAYRDNVDYDVGPEWQDGYNSNSYTRGILDASGGASQVPFDNYFGGSSPLPPHYFAPPHLQGTGFPNSLKRRQPSPTLHRRP